MIRNIFILIFLLLFLFIYYIFFYKIKNNGKLKYLICDKYINKSNHIFTKILDKNGYQRTNSNDWKVYFPCGYNLNEYELKKLNIKPYINYKGRHIAAINGSDQVVGKIKLWNHLNNFYDKNTVKEILSESYDFNSTVQRKNFEKNYKPGSIYVIKTKLQGQKGIEITDNLIKIKKRYKEKNILVQHFIQNQLLIKGYHFNIRIFIVVIFKNRNMNVYLYNEGNIRYALESYTEGKINEKALITKGVSGKKALYNDKPLLISELKEHLKKLDINYDIINKSIIYKIKLIFECLYKKIGLMSNIQKGVNYQLFGGDFMVTKDLKTYFLEFNKGPELGCVQNLKRECDMKQTLQRDIMKLVGLEKRKFKSPYKFEKIFSKKE